MFWLFYGELNSLNSSRPKSTPLCFDVTDAAVRSVCIRDSVYIHVLI